jgi:plasmid stabilization system protein ParE
VPVVWRAKAQTDIGWIVRHVVVDNPVAARRVVREFLLAGDSLAMFPHCGRAGRLAGTRELVAVLSYIIVYRVGDMVAVTILRVWHAGQDRS